MLGAILSLLSAATFGLNNATLRRGVLKGSVLQAMAITVPMGVPLFALGALAFGALGGLAGLSTSAWFWFSVAGVVHFIAGRYGNYRATRAMGANLSGPVQQMSVLVSLGLALIFLDETLNPLSIIGILLIVIGPFIMLPGGDDGGKTKSGFVPNYPEGFVWGLVCAFGYGSSPLFIAWGLSGGGIGESLLGGLVSYAAASVLIGLWLLFPVPRREVVGLERGPAGWFLLAGLFVFFSQMFRYAALAVAPVSVVAPIQRLSVVFRVLFSWLLNRDHEVFGFRVMAGIALSLLGAALLTTSVDWVAAFLPAGLRPVLGWQWP
jgi:drug/metabolite transporter (DMT)-like permease